MIGEYLRLAFGTALVLLPGRLVARTLGQKGTAVTLAWSFAALFVAWTVVFVVHGTVWLAAAVLAVVGVAALVRGRPGTPTVLPGLGTFQVKAALRRPALGHGTVFAGGVVLGLLLWQVAGAVTGDGLFHLARVVKLVDLGDLHLRTVDEFRDGGLHPGYAFPLWHGFLALVAQLSGASPHAVIQHEASILAPLACAVAWEAGVAVFGTAGGGFATLFGSLALYCFAAGHGGSYVSLALPATSSRQLLVPAALALFFTFAGSGRRADLAAVAAAFGALTLVHPTYALFLLIPLAGYAAVRFREWRRSGLALVAALVPTGLVVLWLKPIVDETLSVDPSPAEKLASLHKYAGELTVSSATHYHLAAEVFGRTGAVAIAALVLVPLAGIAIRRPWGALVLGGSVLVLALMLVPVLFMHFADAVSLSQARRAAGFLPFALAFAGGLSVLCRTAIAAPVGLGAGIVLESRWPGDFAYGLRDGGPAVVTWFALLGGILALAAGLVLSRDRRPAVVVLGGPAEARRRRGPWGAERWGLAALTAALFVLPVMVHGFRRWSPLHPTDPTALSASLLQELRAVPARSVIIADPDTSYELLAAAPVYVVAAPVPHVANTRANDPAQRVADVEHWLKTGDPAIPKKYGATWQVRDGELSRIAG